MNLTPKLGAMIRQKAPVAAALRGKPRPPPEGLFCLYPHRSCMQNRLDGYEFCAKHILEDKNSVYKQCNYMSGKSGKRCPSAAPKSDKKEGYCLEHSRRSQVLRQRAGRKRRPRETPETLLEQIEHYGSKAEGASGGVKRGRPSNESITTRILEYASSSDSESERQIVEQAWQGDVDSDAESVDSEQEDALKHAGVYTAEEVALITKDKLIRLQSLYIEQFKRLQHIMREKRRRYLRTAKIERETLGSIHAAKEDPEQRETYEKLLAMKRYHKRYGKEALLHRQSKERRISASEGANYKPPSFPKCQHVSTGTKCLARTIPLSKFCFQHIMDDGHQVLYNPCALGDGSACCRPTAAMDEVNFCTTHKPLTLFKRRYPPEVPTTEESAEEKEHIDVVNDGDVKTEIIVETTETPLAPNHVNSAAHLPQSAEPGSQISVTSGERPAATPPVTGVPAPVTPGGQPASRGPAAVTPGGQPASRTSSRPPSRGPSRPHTPQVPTPTTPANSTNQ